MKYTILTLNFKSSASERYGRFSLRCRQCYRTLTVLCVNKLEHFSLHKPFEPTHGVRCIKIQAYSACLKYLYNLDYKDYDLELLYLLTVLRQNKLERFSTSILSLPMESD